MTCRPPDLVKKSFNFHDEILLIFINIEIICFLFGYYCLFQSFDFTCKFPAPAARRTWWKIGHGFQFSIGKMEFPPCEVDSSM
jgi:hypothetical protein